MEYRVLRRDAAMAVVEEKLQINPCYNAVGRECLKNSIKIKKVMMPEVRTIEQQAFLAVPL